MGYFNPENYFVNKDRNDNKSLFKLMLVEDI